MATTVKTKSNLSIIITVYSETLSVLETIERLFKKDTGYIKEIILVVSPRSSQDCLDICRKAALDFSQVKFLIQKHNPGVGLAIWDGVDAATGTHIVVMAADLETQPETVDLMVRKAEETGCDVVVASRWLKQGSFEGYGRLKVCINYLFQRLFMFLFNTTISDLTFAFKLYRADLIKNIPLESKGAELAFECILKIIKMGAHVEQVPTQWIKRSEGQSKNSALFIVLIKYLKIGFKIYFNPKLLRA